MTVKNIMIINANILGKGAAMKDVELMKEKHLKKLVQNVRFFFNEFRTLDFQNLSDEKIGEKLAKYKLTIDDIKTQYSEPVKKIGQ